MTRSALAAGLVFCALLPAASAQEVSHTPLVIKTGGTAEQPAIYDGHGITIDLGIDVTDQDWEKQGDLWTAKTPFSGPKPIIVGQNGTGLFLDEMPLIVARDRVAERARTEPSADLLFQPPEKLQPGQMGVYSDGRMYFRWPKNKSPETTRIIALPKPWTSAVTIACSHIIVKNITARHACNDGFNIHGNRVGIRLENVKAFSNGDEGISAHDDVQMEVDGAEVAWNGSVDAGITDVDRCSTHYRNCYVHDNVGAAFKLIGKSHSVTDTLIERQAKDFVIGRMTEFRQARIERK